MKNICVLCNENEGENLYGYFVCDLCKSKLGLFSNDTIKKHIKLYKTKTVSYEEEINDRLNFIEKDYIKKKIKLLHIKERLKEI